MALPRTLGVAARAIGRGEEAGKALADAVTALVAAGFDSVDYVALVDAETLEPVTNLSRPARLLAAARIGGTRLIDNIPVDAGDHG